MFSETVLQSNQWNIEKWQIKHLESSQQNNPEQYWYQHAKRRYIL